jgi:hypothetical protein
VRRARLVRDGVQDCRDVVPGDVLAKRLWVDARDEQARQAAGDLAVPAGDGYEHRVPALNARRRA